MQQQDSSASVNQTPEDSSAFQFGKRHAALYLGFAAFVHQQAVQVGVDRIFFLTREGEFFKSVYDRLFPCCGRSESSLRSILLETSRLVTFGPSLEALDPPSLRRIWGQYSNQSLQALLKTLNIPQESVLEHFEREKLAMDQDIPNPWQDSRLQRVLDSEAFRSEVQRHLRAQASLVHRYLDPQFADAPAIMLVDIGWRGSVQDNLAFLYPQTRFLGCYLGLARFFNAQPPNVEKTALGPDRNRSASDFDLLHAVDVMEMLANSPHGSVIGYGEEVDGSLDVIRKSNPEEDSAYWSFTQDYQSGVLAAADECQAAALLDDLRSGQLRKNVLQAWRDILNRPSPELVRAYFSLKHNEEFGLAQYLDKSQTPSLADFCLAPFSITRRARIIRYVRYSQWAQGIVRRKDLPWSSRWALYLIVRMGLVVKGWMHAKPAKDN